MLLDPVEVGGKEGWRDRYYKLKFKADMSDKEFFDRYNFPTTISHRPV